MDLIQGRLEESVKPIMMSTGVVLLNAGAITGDYVSMREYRRCSVILALTPASGTDPAAVTLKQAKTVENSPATEKALPFTRMLRYTPATSENPVETVVTGDTFNTSAAAVSEMFQIDVDENMLDINNGFDCFRINVADPGSVSTPAVVIGLMYEAKNKTNPLPEALVNV